MTTKRKKGVVLNRKYKPLFNSESRFFIITGGRGSGKSFSVTNFVNLLSFESGHNILYTRYSMASASLSIIPEFTSAIDNMGYDHYFKINKTEIENEGSGSNIKFRGLKTGSGNQTASLKSLAGVTTWVLDEAEELMSETDFDKIQLSLRTKGKQNRVILILNPTTKEHWIYKRFFEQMGVEEGFNGTKGNVTYIHTTYLDNIKHLDQSFIDEAERLKSLDIKKYNHTIIGGWLDRAEGVVFENVKIGQFEEHSKPVFGQDFGYYPDPTTLVKVSIDKKRKRIFIKQCFGAQNLKTPDVAAQNLMYAGKSLIVADSAEKRLIEELKSKPYGLNIKGIVKPKVIDRIRLLQEYELIVDPDSVGIISEFNNYIWHDKKSDTPVDMYNHYMDAIGYAVWDQLKVKKRARSRATA